MLALETTLEAGFDGGFDVIPVVGLAVTFLFDAAAEAEGALTFLAPAGAAEVEAGVV